MTEENTWQDMATYTKGEKVLFWCVGRFTRHALYGAIYDDDPCAIIDRYDVGQVNCAVAWMHFTPPPEGYGENLHTLYNVPVGEL